MRLGGILVTMVIGCNSSSTPTPDTGPPPLVPTVTVGVGALNLAVDVNNIHIAGMPCGNYAMMVSCPTSGTVAITGSSQNCPPSGGSGTSSYNFTYVMTACQDNAQGVTIRLDGTAVYSGSVTLLNGTQTNFTENFQAAAPVHIFASSPGRTDVDESCTFATTLTGGGGSASHASGAVCGVPFSS